MDFFIIRLPEGLSVTSPRGSATQGIGVAVSSCPQPRYPAPCGLRPCGLSTAIPGRFEGEMFFNWFHYCPRKK